MQFHAKYPLFDSQSERGFTFSYAILCWMPLKIKCRVSELNLWWQVRPVCSFPAFSLKRLSSCAAIVSLIVSTFFYSLVCFSFTPWNVAVVVRFGVVFLALKWPSTSWIVTYHVFIAGFPFPDILNDWVLSISLYYEHFSHDTGVTTCPLFEAVIES